jgi:ATP-dependent DNA helicase RecQ
MSYLRKKYLPKSDSESDIINDNNDYDDDNDDDDDEIHNLLNEVIFEKTKNKIIEKKNLEKIIKIQSKSDEILLKEYNKLLKDYWGYDGLKDTQFEVIKKVVEENKDVCAILATGFGKSICYQLPYLITKKNIIVISPLIALMYEQGQEMISKGINTAIFNSETTLQTKSQEKAEIIGGITKLIFMTPEFFVKSYDFIQEIRDNLLMVCIDEAHALSTWGFDFRPGYTELNVIREWLPEIPILTLTATASVKVRNDIYKILKLNNPEIIIGNFDRPNLSIKVLPRLDNVIDSIKILLNKYPNQYVIIYCKTRNDTDLVADKLRDLNFEAESYHAGMSDKNKKLVQQNFIDGKIKIMCATIAFGMGINIPGVRLVIHYNCPKNIESYYQEIGRAGRDGKPAECILFYSAKDFKINRFLIKDMKNLSQKIYQEEQIRQIEKYVWSSCCRRKEILSNFGQNIESCTNCDNCLRIINNEIIIKLDYTCPIYLLLNVLTKLNGKFGLGMCINVLLAKKSKIKLWMLEWDEFGCGISYGKDDWWKKLIRYLINDDYVIETQVQGMFYSTTDLTNKGKELTLKLLTKFPNYQKILKDSTKYLTKPSKTYTNKYQMLYPEIIIIKKTIIKSTTNKYSTNKYSTNKYSTNK